ncbi:hypothetical protein ACFL5N_02145, partial [bacterium]
TSKEILLFLAVEQNNKKLIKKLLSEGVCLDIWTKEGKSLFKIATAVAMRQKDSSVFELLVSEIRNRPIYDDKIKADIKKCINILYFNELKFLETKLKKIDRLKDFPKLKKLGEIKTVFAKYEKLVKIVITPKLFQKLIFSIYKSYDEIPCIKKLKSIREAV